MKTSVSVLFSDVLSFASKKCDNFFNFFRKQSDDLVEAVAKHGDDAVDSVLKGGTSSKVTSNLGNEIDITPSSNHTTTTKKPGLKGTPNSSIDIVDPNGNLKTRRWFDPDGTQIRDVDFTNHGNAKLHPEWPHVHGPR